MKIEILMKNKSLVEQEKIIKVIETPEKITKIIDNPEKIIKVISSLKKIKMTTETTEMSLEIIRDLTVKIITIAIRKININKMFPNHIKRKNNRKIISNNNHNLLSHLTSKKDKIKDNILHQTGSLIYK